MGFAMSVVFLVKLCPTSGEQSDTPVGDAGVHVLPRDACMGKALTRLHNGRTGKVKKCCLAGFWSLLLERAWVC